MGNERSLTSSVIATSNAACKTTEPASEPRGGFGG
jgi:hypothetical protein